jgi:PhoPQ-activated pathogenicity-related protein
MTNRLEQNKLLLITLFLMGLTLWAQNSISDPAAAGGKHSSEKHSSDKHSTALEDYVNTDDGVFSFTPTSTIELDGATAHLLMLQSQKWRSSDEIDKTVWEHGLVVVIPEKVVTNKSLLFIWSGDNNGNELEIDDNTLAAIHLFATSTGSIVSLVGQVPNQPLVFADDPGNARDEDALVAYTFDRAMRTDDPLWPAYLPMVKSTVKAMDAVTEFVKQSLSSEISIDGFVVSGFSKRGATAWLTAAVDERVIAVAPGVFDVLNFAPSMENHKKSYGEYSSAVGDYVSLGIMSRLRTIEGRRLLKTIDPYSYRNKLDMPKYIINATGDQFFTPDSSSFYIQDLLGDNNIRYVPNTDHGGSNNGLESIMAGLLGWYQRILSETPAPKIQWQQSHGRLTVTTDQKPVRAIIWRAHNPNGRDFRYEKLGAAWQPEQIELQGSDQGSKQSSNEYKVNLESPATGANAYLLELHYIDESTNRQEVYSTPVFITPSKRPFPLPESTNQTQPSRFWAMEFNAAAGNLPHYQPTYDADTLTSFLPVKVLNKLVYSIEDAKAIFTDYSTLEAIGIGECLAARMNIESDRLHWYSDASLDSGVRFVWQDWNSAHRSFEQGYWWLAAGKCWWLNR